MTNIHTEITLDKPQKAQSHFVEKCKYKVRKKLFGRLSKLQVKNRKIICLWIGISTNLTIKYIYFLVYYIFQWIRNSIHTYKEDKIWKWIPILHY